MSAGPLNNFQLRPGNVLLYHRTFHCNISSNRKDTLKEIERTTIQINMTTVLKELMNDASAVSCTLGEFETKTNWIRYSQLSQYPPRVINTKSGGSSSRCS